jgi:hypothetical protein
MHLYHRSAATWDPLDPSPLDDAHPIPNLQVIDIHAVSARSIIVRLHPRSDPAVEEVLAAAVSWAEARNASLRVEKIMPVAIT